MRVLRMMALLGISWDTSSMVTASMLLQADNKMLQQGNSLARQPHQQGVIQGQMRMKMGSHQSLRGAVTMRRRLQNRG
jgi:hypothetical protein